MQIAWKWRKDRFESKIRNGARSCAVCLLGIRKYLSRLGLKIVKGFDEVVVAVLIDMIGSEIHKLVLRLHIVDGNLSFLHELLHEEVPEGDVLRPWAKESVSRHMKCRCGIDVYRNDLESLLEV